MREIFSELFSRKIEKRHWIQTALLGVFFLGCLFVALSQKICLGQEYLILTVNDMTIGAIPAGTDVPLQMRQARKEIASQSETPICMEITYTTAAEKKWFTPILAEDEIENQIVQALKSAQIETKSFAYEVTVGDFDAYFHSMDEVEEFLNGTKTEEDPDGLYETVLSGDADHESETVNAVLTKRADEANSAADADGTFITADETNISCESSQDLSAGISRIALEYLKDAIENPDDNHYETGLLDLDFTQEVTVATTLISADSFSNVEESIAQVTKEEETNKIYQVQAGDCLSTIAEQYDLKLARLMELNGFTNENETIHIDQELIVAVPEPDLSLTATIGEVYEEDYEEDATIIPNDSWYTTEEVVLSEGVTGHREVNAYVTYENGIETERTVAHTTVFVQSEAAVIEKGTIIPPTYIKPLSGGRFTSGFGKRWGRMHKGVDWACSVGTTIYASSAGVVEYAGWTSGYGYNVLIDHPDGRKTRYAHLSKTLVTAGQSVSQGQTIAKSGNTGRSTGPHVHFEIFINGTQVNPLDYIN